MYWEKITQNNLDIIIEYIRNNIKYNIILLYGDLGTGKTTLIKKICLKLFNINNVISPTYSIVNIYNNNNNIIYHFDLYRIQNIEQLIEIGFCEYIYSGKLCFIEWPKKNIIKNFISNNFHKIEISYNSYNYRTIRFD